MAGSFKMLIAENGAFMMGMIENMGDAMEALNDSFRIINVLRRKVCNCGFTDFASAEAHNPQCVYRAALEGNTQILD